MGCCVTDSPFATTEDRLLGGRLLIRQPRDGFRIAVDTLLLAAAIDVPPDLPPDGAAVLELGCGVGGAALALAWRCPAVRVIGVEANPAIADLARGNAAANGLADRVAIRTANVAGFRLGGEDGVAERGAGQVDQVMANPPFHPADDPSPQVLRREAKADSGLMPWVDTASRCLRHRGVFTLIHRADALDRVLIALSPRFGSITVLPIWPRAGGLAETVQAKPVPAKRVIVRAVKGGRGGLTLLPGLTLHDGQGYTDAARAILEGAAPLSLAT